MLRTAFSITLLIMLQAPSFSADNYTAEIRTGVSREIIDYENDSMNLLLKIGTAINLADCFDFNFTALRNIDAQTSSCTWNIAAKELSGFLDFISGNYNLHFGSGLMMGRASYRSGDPFSRKISISKEQAVIPSNGGNPEYSFSGTAFDFHNISEDLKINFIPFCSIQKRYISYESFDEGVIDSSLFSLNPKIRPGGNYTEPVNIINYGAAALMQTSSYFNLQAYYFETDLKGDSGKDILWDRDSDYGGAGIDLIRNSGLFAEYADKNISIFIEPAMSSVESTETVTDFALASGIAVRNSAVNFSIRGKNCGPHFHSEYSSGSRTPERIWETRCGIFPLNFLETGFVLYSEKDLTPAHNRDYTEGSVQEEIFLGYGSAIADINLNIKRKEHYSCDRDDPADQGYLSAELPLSDRMHLKIRTSAQKCSGDISSLYGGEARFFFLEYFSLSAGYTEIRIGGDLPYYTVISPASEHSSLNCFSESARGVSVNFKYKKERDYFYVRFTLVKQDAGFSADAESALTLFF